jgi:hypothetical protein
MNSFLGIVLTFLQHRNNISMSSRYMVKHSSTSVKNRLANQTGCGGVRGRR